MIFVWIGLLLARIRWLLVPPSESYRHVRRIDINAPCPICGHRKGSLSVGMNGGKPACQHNCLVCGGTSFEQPTVNDFLSPVAAAQAAALPSPPATSADAPKKG